MIHFASEVFYFLRDRIKLGPCAHRKVNFVYFVGNKEIESNWGLVPTDK